jgi:GcrA cell cycle regulator
MTPWTEDRVERLKKLWAEGMSAGQIRDELGGTSRNAVIGKVRRLDLARRPNPVASQQPKLKQERRKPGPIASLVTPARFGDAPDWPPEPRFRKHYPAEPLAISKPVSILDLTSSTCRWPLEQANVIGGYLFCGGKALDGCAYCRTHQERAGSTAPARARKAAA